MNKFLIIFVSILTVVLVSVAGIGGWYVKNQDYNSRNKKISAQISEKSAEVEKLRAAKDEKGYSPKNVATNFMNEFRSDSEAKAKLYLSESQQTTDLKKAMKIEKDLDKITVTEVTEEITGESAVSVVSGYIGEESQGFSVLLSMIKEKNLWKINQIN
jgi:preprotein translocase subunit SecF